MLYSSTLLYVRIVWLSVLFHVLRRGCLLLSERSKHWPDIQCTIYMLHAIKNFSTGWKFSTLYFATEVNGSVAWQLNQWSAAKSIKQFHNINKLSSRQVSMGKGQVKEMCFETFPEGCNCIESTGRRRLFQREGAQKWNAHAPVLFLTLRTDRVIPLFDLSE